MKPTHLKENTHVQGFFKMELRGIEPAKFNAFIRKKQGCVACRVADNKYKRLDNQNSNFDNMIIEDNISFANYKNTAVVSTTSNCLAFYSKKTVRLEFGILLLSQHLGEENVTIFTLPETIRPSFLSYFNLASTDGTYTAKCHVDLNGDIIVAKMPSTAKYIGGQAHYRK